MRHTRVAQSSLFRSNINIPNYVKYRILSDPLTPPHIQIKQCQTWPGYAQRCFHSLHCHYRGIFNVIDRLLTVPTQLLYWDINEFLSGTFNQSCINGNVNEQNLYLAVRTILKMKACSCGDHIKEAINDVEILLKTRFCICTVTLMVSLMNKSYTIQRTCQIM